MKRISDTAKSWALCIGAIVFGAVLMVTCSGCVNSDLARRGVPLCRHYAIAWCEARQSAGYDVAIVTLFNPRTKKAHAVCKARYPGQEKWVYIDPQTGQIPDLREYAIVDERTDIQSPAPYT